MIEKSRLITGNAVHLIDFDNIQIINQTDDSTDYSIDAVLELAYTLKDGSELKESVNVSIVVSHMLNEVFTVEDVYMSDEMVSENDAGE